MYQQRLPIHVINEIKQNLTNSINLLNKYQSSLLPTEKHTMMNHLEFVNNMLNEMLVPSTFAETNDFEYSRVNKDNMKIVYNKSGDSTLIDRNRREFKQEWERQFDESQNINPPCYIMPPQSLTGLTNIKRAIRKGGALSL